MQYLTLEIEREDLEDIKLFFKNTFVKRLLSSAILVFLALYLNYLGGYYFLIAICISGSILLQEYYKLFNENINQKNFFFNLLFGNLFLLSIFFNKDPLAIYSLLLGILLSLYYTKKRFFFYIVSYFYFFIPLGALISLNVFNEGKLIIYWIYIVVWSVDIGGYIFGKLLKGPKLIPFISPNKTWSGLIAGLLLAGSLSYLYADILYFNNKFIYFIHGVIGGAISVIGDLFESKLKRINNKKDSSLLIPGHGGLLDRLDGFLFAILYFWVLKFNWSFF